MERVRGRECRRERERERVRQEGRHGLQQEWAKRHFGGREADGWAGGQGERG